MSDPVHPVRGGPVEDRVRASRGEAGARALGAAELPVPAPAQALHPRERLLVRGAPLGLTHSFLRRICWRSCREIPSRRAAPRTLPSDRAIASSTRVART